MKLWLAIAAGGALGALGRYAFVSQVGAWMGHGFPWGILLANILGSFLMGVLVEASALFWSPSPELRALLAVGVLGAFTTFSTFSLDVAVLSQRGEWLSAALYVVASVSCGIAALFAGMALVRAVAS